MDAYQSLDTTGGLTVLSNLRLKSKNKLVYSSIFLDMNDTSAA